MPALSNFSPLLPQTHTRDRILVGMSGGVDSSVAAALLVQQGFDVIGVTLRLYAYAESLEETAPEKQECHPDKFIEDAQEVAKTLGIPHHILDAQDLFQRVIIDPFLQAYEQGRTPLPCAVCNRDVKTAALHELMPSLGATGMATGHYVQDKRRNQTVEIHRGMDPVRDQSFFLFNLSWEQIQLTRFPLGAFSKEDTRALAKQFGLKVHGKQASQDLCFISKRSYVEMFKQRNPESIQPGDIIDEEGTILGQHKGLVHYTIGQRQGVGVGGMVEPLHVLKLEVPSNRLVVGPRHRLAHRHVFLQDVNWLGEDLQSSLEAEKNHKIHVKIRSSSRPMKASLLLSRGTRDAVVKLAEPEFGVAVGQACVFYQDTRLLGGGWIQGSAP